MNDQVTFLGNLKYLRAFSITVYLQDAANLEPSRYKTIASKIIKHICIDSNEHEMYSMQQTGNRYAAQALMS